MAVNREKSPRIRRDEEGNITEGRCGRCNKWLPADSFGKTFTRAGKSNLQSYCILCKRELSVTPIEKRVRTVRVIKDTDGVVLVWCSVCKKYLAAEYFTVSTRFGFQSACKACSYSRNLEYDKNRNNNRSDLEITKLHEMIPGASIRKYDGTQRLRAQASRSNKRSKNLGHEGRVAPQDWVLLVEIFDYKCLACGDDREEYLSLDHVIPLDDGDMNYIDNLQPLCLKCNLKKGVRVVDFRPEGTLRVIYENCQGPFMDER